MSSLLATAAYFEAQDVDRPKGKRNAAKTIKRRPINKSVETLMNITAESDDEDDDGLAEFKPLKPELTRVPETKGAEQPVPLDILQQRIASAQSNNTYSSLPSNYRVAHQPPEQLPIKQNHYQNNNNNNTNNQAQDDINSRLNYIIHLLEEQQNSKTSTTTEELILYTFLGVFTIYIVDSFSKVGKMYSR